MKKIFLFQLMIITAFISFPANQAFAELDVLREVDQLVDNSKPNVLLIIATDKFMTRDMGDTESSGNSVSANVADDAASSSRFYNVKCVLIGSDLDSSCNASEEIKTGILEQTKDKINYGLMTYNQKKSVSGNSPSEFAYYPYYENTDCSAAPNTCSGTPDVINTEYQGDSYTCGSETCYYYNYTSASFSQYPIDDDEGGKLWIQIDPHDSLTQNGPKGASEADSDEVTVMKKFLALQNDGGIALDDTPANDDRVFEVFKKEDGDNYNDAYEYFKNVIMEGDPVSKNGCFTKNYIIFLADGFGNTNDYSTAATNAASLFALDLVTSGDYASNTTPVKTFVIGVIDPDASGMSNTAGLLDEIARNGGTDATEPVAYGLNATSIPADDGDHYAFFVQSKAELQEALENIADAIAGGDFVTGSPSATSSSGAFVSNNVGMLASTEYPDWRGHLRSVDLVDNQFWWDAGAVLFVPAARDNLPKAVDDYIDANVAYPSDTDTGSSKWQDTDGDGTIDQPPLTLIVGAGNDVYNYTDRVLYCRNDTTTPGDNYDNYDDDNCISSVLISNEFKGSTVTFSIGGTDTTYAYVGAFYVPPWANRNVFTSDLSGTLIDLYDSLSNTGDLDNLGGSDLGDWFSDMSGSTDTEKRNYAKKIITFALGAVKGVDLNGDGDTDDTVSGVYESTVGIDLDFDGDTQDSVDGVVEADTHAPRQWLLGDITNMVPVGVGKPINPKDGLTGRGTFRDTYSGRDTMIYTGSNDQMFRGIVFETGLEKFAYVPPDLLPNLKTLYENAIVDTDSKASMGQPANPSDHVYGISSSPKVNDVQIDDDGDGVYATEEWHTVIISGEGPGGNHLFALDVTDPSLDFGTATTTGPVVPGYTLLWHTAQTSTDNLVTEYGGTLGETWSVPAFARVQTGSGTYKWVLFAGSGYDDANADAGYGGGEGEIFYVIDVADGTLLTGKTTGDEFFMTGTSPTVKFGLLPDSVSMIQKTDSKVEDGYQVDLKGRVYHIDTSIDASGSVLYASGWQKTEIFAGASFSDFTNPDVAKPFYYSPSVWDFDNTSDTSTHLMVLGSGAYDDPEMEAQDDDDDGDGTAASDESGDSLRNSTITDDLTTTLYFTIVDPTTPTVNDAFSIEMSEVNGTEVDDDGNITGTAVAGTLTGARLIASPVLFNNYDSDTNTYDLQALFLVFLPPAAGELGCSFGNSYLLVFSLGDPDTILSGSSGFASTSEINTVKDDKEAKFVVSMGTGKVSGIGIAGGGSHIVVGQSGYGTGDTSGFNLAGSDSWDPIGTMEKLFWKHE